MFSAKKVNKSVESYIRDAVKSAKVTKVLATLSGGPDSVALIAALKSLSHISVTAAHCNFHLRGKKATETRSLSPPYARNLEWSLK